MKLFKCLVGSVLHKMIYVKIFQCKVQDPVFVKVLKEKKNKKKV